ncbi:uncharacterized protein BX663DRAFT_511683 [Cokeromyces recurvatus]|uniref:uncharacterized protein n=1 Tax=Cokeromyces recurvatus TaxID=90255 RepID=UPI00221F8113|nr:uncharacterized protein BX663DRAFT_511683 [Cokeromyces recurvatus]KAI7902081.1 hypothetical protein BX663DRAFT_511683 [Cokeromyces recurvatus]
MRDNDNGNDNTNTNTPNRVRGPTSALSSFLREHGIRVVNQSRRSRRENSGNNESNRTESEASTNITINSAAAEETVSETGTTTIRSAAQTTSVSYRATASSSSKSKKNKKRKRKNGTDDDDDDDDYIGSDDDFSPSTSRKIPTGRARILFCTKCNGRFVLKTNENETLCSNCRAGPSKKPATRKKKTPPAIKKTTYPKEHLPSLQDICISIVANYIDQVESFGFISDDNFEKLAKIISRNRKLNNQTAKLFMEPYRKFLSLYDCTNMTEDGLYMISQFCPRLTKLQLIYCGHMTDRVLNGYKERLHHLSSLEVSGAFLVTKKAWISFFECVGPRLESFSIRHSARFTKECLEALVTYCPNLKELKLGHLSHLDSDWLTLISQLKNLKTLELAWTTHGHTFKTQDVVDMLSEIGSQLEELTIRGGHDLTDDILYEGLLKNCHRLKKLGLEQCEKLSAKAMVEFLDNWETKGLSHLNISRCILFDDEVIKAVIRHSGETLKQLNLHSLELVTATGLESLAGSESESTACKGLTHLNCGFVRSMDDFVLQKLINCCKSLEHVQVWGCHLVK